MVGGAGLRVQQGVSREHLPDQLGLLRKNAAVEAFNVLGSLGASLVLAALGLWLGGLL
ncbi:hypothetical protein [Micromonospora sp. NPDC047134]|uniref:hypothetical protein n=1 Tax=Micromonospora sp. NPDC047134 TaxID=3154340 RepID=UPI0033D35B96